MRGGVLHLLFRNTLTLSVVISCHAPPSSAQAQGQGATLLSSPQQDEPGAHTLLLLFLGLQLL